MRLLFTVFLALLLGAAAVHAADFAPARLVIEAGEIVPYAFDGTPFQLPVSVSGTPARTLFLVFTKDRAESIGAVENGHLGWHYVNRVDTCIYVSPPHDFQPGPNTVSWDGSDQDGNPVPPGEYTYYLWGFDNQSPKQLMSRHLPGGWGFDYYSDILTVDEDGLPLANPVWYTFNKRWRIGSDPLDGSLMETSEVNAPEEWTIHNQRKPLVDPLDHTRFYTAARNGDMQQIGLIRFDWTPGGTSGIDTSFGTDGFSDLFDSPGNTPGVVSDGTHLYTAEDNHTASTEPRSRFYWYDMNGALAGSVSMTEWWSSPEDYERGAQMNGGPVCFDMEQGKVFLGGHVSCLNQMVDPARYMETGEAADFFVWSNGNGDYVLDKNFTETANLPWACNDYNVEPYKYSFSADEHLFSQACVYFIGDVSFGLLAPDGTGLGHFAFAGETNGWKKGSVFLDAGTPYDGIYCDNQQTGGPHTEWDRDAAEEGIFYVGHDSMRGIITTAGAYVWLQNPAGGETFGAGTTHTVRWSSNDVTRVNVEYSTDGGATWTEIAEGVEASARSVSWTAPDLTSDRCLVRITDASDATVSDTSNSFFTITEPYVRVTAPNGGEVVEAGTTFTVAWEFLGVEAVDIAYSTDGGSSWTSAAEGVDASKRNLAWTVPDAVSETCLVRISDSSNGEVSDESDDVFAIAESFLVISAPAQGDVFESGTSLEIVWSSSESVNTINLSFSSDGGNNWKIIATDIKDSLALYSLRVPDEVSSNCIIRATTPENIALTGFSGIFSIVPSSSPWRTYTADDGIGSDHIWGVTADPRGGVWIATSGGGASYFNGVSWTNYRQENTGMLPNDIYDVGIDAEEKIWFIPTWDRVVSFDGESWHRHEQGPGSGRYMDIDQNNVKYIGTAGSGVAVYDDISWHYFTPENSGLTCSTAQIPFAAPDGSLWIASGGSCGVWHYDGEHWFHYTRENGLADDQTHGVTVDHDGIVWVATAQGLCRFDGESWKTYTTTDGLVHNHCEFLCVDYDNILWIGTRGGVSCFDGVEFKSWTPDNSSLRHSYVIKIAVDTDNVKWFATTGGGVTRFDHQTGPTVRITSPNGGELWEAGTEHTVTWKARDVDTVELDYSTDGGESWREIARGLDASTGAYGWTLPAIDSESCLVRISDPSDAAEPDISYKTFTIAPPFVRVTSPAGGERWARGTVHEIAWTDIGVERVNISLSTDGGETWNTVAENVENIDGAYAWTVPAVESPSCLIRVADAAEPSRADECDGPFTIMEPYVEVVYPNGGEILDNEEPVMITWESDGVEDVRIEYTVDSGATWNLIASSWDASRGALQWEPYPVQSMLCFVRITDVKQPDVWDESDTIFTYLVTREVSVEEERPLVFMVGGNFPNPFNGETTIPFSIPEGDQVTVEVFSITGQRVAELADGFFPAGRHELHWDAKGASTGIYLYRVRAGREVRTMKMLLVK